MTKKISKYVATTLCNNGFFKHQDVLIYEFCFKYIIEQFLYLTSILLLSFILGQPLIGLILILIYMPLRMLGGGIHAPNAILCTILSYTIDIGVLLFVPVAYDIAYTILFISFFISEFIIWNIAPIDTKNKRLSEDKKCKLKYKCHVILIIFFIIFIISSFLHIKSIYITESICVIINMFSMLAGKFVNSIFK